MGWVSKRKRFNVGYLGYTLVFRWYRIVLLWNEGWKLLPRGHLSCRGDYEICTWRGDGHSISPQAQGQRRGPATIFAPCVWGGACGSRPVVCSLAPFDVNCRGIWGKKHYWVNKEPSNVYAAFLLDSRKNFGTVPSFVVSVFENTRPFYVFLLSFRWYSFE